MLNSEIRPHHGLCTAFFEGKGYSPAFVRHMTFMINYLNCQNPDIRLVLHSDSICSACPHNQNQICESAEKVLAYDTSVLRLCGLEENTSLLWSEYCDIVHDKILRRGRLCEVCKDCQWRFICLDKSKQI